MLRVAGRACSSPPGRSTGPVPDRLPDDPDDRVAVPAAGDRRLRPRAGGAGHPRRPAAASPAGWRPRPEPASRWQPSAATCCRSGSGCSGSQRSAPPQASSPAWSRWPRSRSWPRSHCSGPGGRRGQGRRQRGSDPGQIPRPDPPGDHPDGSNDRRGAGGRGASAARASPWPGPVLPRQPPRARARA